jgi:hypothetical protein
VSAPDIPPVRENPSPTLQATNRHTNDGKPSASGSGTPLPARSGHFRRKSDGAVCTVHTPPQPIPFERIQKHRTLIVRAIENAHRVLWRVCAVAVRCCQARAMALSLIHDRRNTLRRWRERLIRRIGECDRRMIWRAVRFSACRAPIEHNSRQSLQQIGVRREEMEGNVPICDGLLEWL